MNETMEPIADQAPEETIELTAETLRGELAKFVIDELKAAPDVWQKLNQHQQDDVIERVVTRCASSIKQAVHLIAADGREVITADLEQINAKDEIKAVLKLPKYDQNRHALLDAVGKPVLIVVAGSSQFMGGETPKSEPDQRELVVDGSDDSADDTPVADNSPATAAEAA